MVSPAAHVSAHARPHIYAHHSHVRTHISTNAHAHRGADGIYKSISGGILNRLNSIRHGFSDRIFRRLAIRGANPYLVGNAGGS